MGPWAGRTIIHRQWAQNGTWTKARRSFGYCPNSSPLDGEKGAWHSETRHAGGPRAPALVATAKEAIQPICRVRQTRLARIGT